MPEQIEAHQLAPLSGKGAEKGEKSISWADDGKNSNLIALAEATLEIRPYLSAWGDIQQKWNEVARLLGERKAIPSGKNFRAVQGKMKDLLDQLQRFQDDMKKPNLTTMPRCPFSEKLLRLLTAIQEQCGALLEGLFLFLLVHEIYFFFLLSR